MTCDGSVVIAGSLKFASKTYAEFYMTLNNGNFTSEVSIPLDTTRFNIGGQFTLNVGGEIYCLSSMLISVSFKVSLDIAVGT